MSEASALLADPAGPTRPFHRTVALHLCALSPILLVFVMLQSFNSIVAAVLLFQALCLAAQPLLFLATTPNQEGFTVYSVELRRLLRNWRHQLPFAVAGFLLCVVAGFMAFIFVQWLGVLDEVHVVHVARKDGINSHVLRNDAEIVLLALDFTFVNSLLEELFWRVFLYRELGPTFRKDGCNVPKQNDLEMDAAEAEAEPVVTCLGVGVSAGEAGRLLVSTYYAGYHVVVMLFFVQWYLAFCGLVGLIVLGRIFVYCREDERFGLLTSYGIHAGVDGAFCLIMLQLFTDFFR